MKKSLNIFRFTVFAFILLGLTSLSSCIWVRSVLGENVEIRASVSPRANLNNSVAVDVLLVYDEELLKELLKMTAKDWFEKRDQIRQDLPKDTGFESWQWEWTPGQQITPRFIPLKSKAKACLVFANYFTPGAHRIRTDPYRSFFLNLDEKDFTVESIR